MRCLARHALTLNQAAPDNLSGGSEAVEAAWKLCREYHLANGQPQRTKAIARDVAYHGVTLGALSFTGVERFKTPFGRAPIDVTHVSNTRHASRQDPRIRSGRHAE